MTENILTFFFYAHAKPDPLASSAAIAQDQLARREAKEIARIISLDEQCQALMNVAQSIPKEGLGPMVGLPMGIQAFNVCAQYDQAVQERLIYERLRSQQR